MVYGGIEMRRLVFLFTIISGITMFAIACSRSEDVPKISSKVFFVDSRLNRLIAYDTDIIDADRESKARAVLDKLIEGRDDNPNIRRIIPEKPDCLSVYVRDNVAYVNISSQIKDDINFGRDIEELFIYQIVNSLTSIKGIRFVKFTIDGAIHKDFLGFFDMRETYKYTHPL